MRSFGGTVVSGAFAFLLLFAPVAWPQTGDDAPAADSEGQAEEGAKERSKIPFGLYLFAGLGEFDVDEINSSIETSSSQITRTSFDIDSANYARVAIGWRLPDGKGDFRLIFNGFAEDGYVFNSNGLQRRTANAIGDAPIIDPLSWWNINIQNGVLTSTRDAPIWNQGTDDANGDGAIQAGEVQLGNPDFVGTAPVNSDLENRAQTWDIVYGNTFGKPRYSARWFAGLRHFVYEGNVLATAWLGELPNASVGFTDGFFIPLLSFSQETSGTGPVGMLEAQFNFFERQFQIYLHGEAAFLIADLETTTGGFFSLVDSTVGDFLLNVPGSLGQSRSRSSWQNRAELGFRVLLRNGLEFEAGYGITGYLDSILLPPLIQIPADEGEAVQPASAVFTTQDLIFEGWHAGVGLQF